MNTQSSILNSDKAIDLIHQLQISIKYELDEINDTSLALQIINKPTSNVFFCNNDIPMDSCEIAKRLELIEKLQEVKEWLVNY